MFICLSTSLVIQLEKKEYFLYKHHFIKFKMLQKNENLL
jgi:hypothetical protein